MCWPYARPSCWQNSYHPTADDHFPFNASDLASLTQTLDSMLASTNSDMTYEFTATSAGDCMLDAGQSQAVGDDMGMDASSRKWARSHDSEEEEGEGEVSEEDVGDDTYQECTRPAARVRRAAPKKGGGGGGGNSCPRGGKKKAQVAGQWVTQAERRALAQMGPEGLGGVNEGNDQEAYAREHLDQGIRSLNSSQLKDSGNTTVSSSLSQTASTDKLPCGYMLHNDGAAREEIQVLGLRAGQFLVTLSAGCQECLEGSKTSTTMVTNPLDVFRALIFGIAPGALQSTSSTDPCGQVIAACTQTDLEASPQSPMDALKSVVLQCVEAEILDAVAQLMYWVNTMHFAAMVMQ